MNQSKNDKPMTATYSQFTWTRQTQAWTEFQLGTFSWATEERVVEVLLEVWDKYFRINRIVDATTVHRLIKQSMHKLPLYFITTF